MKRMAAICFAAVMATGAPAASNGVARISRLPPDLRQKLQDTGKYLKEQADERSKAAAESAEMARLRDMASRSASPLERAAAQDAVRLEEYRRRQAEEGKR